MSEEEKKALESVKSIFEYATIEELIKNKDINITIYSLGIIDILKVIAIVDKQQEEIKKHEENELILCMDIEKQQEKVKQQQKEIENLNAEILELINQKTDGFWENDRLKNEIEELKKKIKKLTRLNSAYKTNYDSKVLKEERKNKKILEGYISKDKIREKIKELKTKKIGSNTGIYSVQIDILEKLLEK